MSEHKTGRSNWSEQQKENYRTMRRRTSRERHAVQRALTTAAKPIDRGEVGAGRRRLRFKQKNRDFTRKGMTRVVKVEEGKAVNIPTKIGSRLHQRAIANVKKIHKGSKRGE